MVVQFKSIFVQSGSMRSFGKLGYKHTSLGPRRLCFKKYLTESLQPPDPPIVIDKFVATLAAVGMLIMVNEDTEAVISITVAVSIFMIVDK